MANAEGRKNDKEMKEVIQAEAQDVAASVKPGKDQAERRGKKNKDKVRDAMRDDSDDDSDSDDSDSDDSNHGEKSDSVIEEGDRAARGLDNAATRGNEKSQEMRARRDEGKVIKEEYKSADKGEMMVVDGVAESSDADSDTESNEKKEKKPWWKFWNQ
jgi:hypothetical protein